MPKILYLSVCLPFDRESEQKGHTELLSGCIKKRCANFLKLANLTSIEMYEEHRFFTIDHSK